MAEPFPVWMANPQAQTAHRRPDCVRLASRPTRYSPPFERLGTPVPGAPGSVMVPTLRRTTHEVEPRTVRLCSDCGRPEEAAATDDAGTADRFGVVAERLAGWRRELAGDTEWLRGLFARHGDAPRAHRDVITYALRAMEGAIAALDHAEAQVRRVAKEVRDG